MNFILFQERNNMKHRQIVITVDFDMKDFRSDEITPPKRVKEIVEKDIINLFIWDEGYMGVKVGVYDIN